MRTIRLTALLLVALALALVAAGCGGDDEGKQIPSDQARALVTRLQEAKRRVSQDPPVCGDLSEESIPALEELVDDLPQDTDEGIRETLQDGIDHLRSLIEAECASRQEEEPTTTETQPTTTETQPTTTETQPTTTETQPTTTETTPPPPTTPDPNNGGGQGVPEKEGE